MANNSVFSSLVRRDLLYTSVAGGVDGNYAPATEPAVDGFYAAYFEMSGPLQAQLLQNSPVAPTNNIGYIPFDWKLFSLIQAISLPNLNIQKKTWVGYQEQKIHYPTTLEYDADTITLTMWDTYNSFLLNVITAWLLFLQAQAGTPALLDSAGELKANLVVILYDPTLLVPQFAVLFLGVFPIGVPLGSVQADVANIQLRTLQVSFSFDRMICDNDLLMMVQQQNGFVQQLNTLLTDPASVYSPPKSNFKVPPLPRQAAANTAEGGVF
jgi:hypothetical protein